MDNDSYVRPDISIPSRTGMATFTLDYGQCPKWLFERMVGLGREVIHLIIQDYGQEEFLKRISDPVWFQALGTALAFDWNASGLTTVLTAALKEAIKGSEADLGIFICGGKGKTSLKTPDEINNWCDRIGFDEQKSSSLVNNSKMAAKVDSSLVQDGYQIYHHAFLFSESGSWAVVQQGMNTQSQTARRYHWAWINDSPAAAGQINTGNGAGIDFVCEPHSGIAAQLKAPTLNLTARESGLARSISAELVNNGFGGLMKDVNLLRRYFSRTSQMATLGTKSHQLTLLNLEGNEKDIEVKQHPVIFEDFTKSRYLEKILYLACEIKPKTYKDLLSVGGVGPKTMRALALISELIYGAPLSFRDPARYGFTFGGKDNVPYPIDRGIYDESIEIIKKAVLKSKLGINEKKRIVDRIS